ncbi:TetR/AcrR family transcriptional regulator [Parvibaculum sp.]|uniref:TetR/AcrR family transcriptional regulator n=1 Tax=Parvibaculum sp. TaxID=2024848 RepID=UPI00391B7788
MPKKIDHDQRRRDIARAAISVIGEQGIDNTRLVDVARAANATTGTITHYFEDKDAVLLAALDHVAQNILFMLRSPDRPDDLVELASLILPLDEDSLRDWRVWMSFFGRAVGDPALARINKAYYDEFRDGLAAIIRRQQAEGRLSPGIDPAMTGDAIISIIDGFCIRATLEREEWPEERQKAQLEAMLRPLLPRPEKRRPKGGRHAETRNPARNRKHG